MNTLNARVLMHIIVTTTHQFAKSIRSSKTCCFYIPDLVIIVHWACIVLTGLSQNTTLTMSIPQFLHQNRPMAAQTAILSAVMVTFFNKTGVTVWVSVYVHYFKLFACFGFSLVCLNKILLKRRTLHTLYLLKLHLLRYVICH